VADFVGANALHKSAVSTPNLGPIDHVVIRGAVDCAGFVVDALVCGMNGADYLTEVVLPVSLLFI
jgi:methylaspartate ammonia-lyase